MRFKRFFAAALAMALLFTTLVGCGKRETVLRCDLNGEVGTLDPQFAKTDAAFVLISNLFEGLVRVGEQDKILPACAESWQISPDRLRYTFLLREGLRWADGAPLTADDFVFGLQRLFDPVAASPHAANYRAVKNAEQILKRRLSADALGVSAPDARTLVIELDYPDVTLLRQLAHPSAMPCNAAFFAAQKGRYSMSAEAMLGNGPFVLDRWTDASLRLIPNPHGNTTAALDRVLFYIGQTNPVQRYLQGETDLVLVEYEQLNRVKDAEGSLFYDQCWLLVINATRTRLQNEDVRRALIGAIDFDALHGSLGKSTHADLTPTLVPLTMQLSGENYREQAGPLTLPAPVENPRALLTAGLAQAGLAADALDGLTLLVPEYEPGPSMGSVLLRSWQETFPIYANMQQLGMDTLRARSNRGDYDIALVPLSSKNEGAVAYLSNFSKLSFSLVEGEQSLSTLLTEARQESDPAATARLLRQVEQQVIEHCVVLPVFNAPSLLAVNGKLRGVEYDADTRILYLGNAYFAEE